jgi:hypothetical protein
MSSEECSRTEASMFDQLKSERRKWATPIDRTLLRGTPTLPGFRCA